MIVDTALQRLLFNFFQRISGATARSQVHPQVPEGISEVHRGMRVDMRASKAQPCFMHLISSAWHRARGRVTLACRSEPCKAA